MTVEHVNVADGGQAIVGQVTHGAGKANGQLPDALDHKDTPTLDAAPAKPKVKSRKS